MAWELHLARYPPLEHIIARIWLSLHGKDADLTDMGFWLESPQDRKDREAAEEKARRRREARETALAYREQQKAC